MKKEKQNKKNYLAPAWRVVSFKPERGAFLSGSGLPINGDPINTNQIQQYEEKAEGVTGWGTFN